LRLRLSATRSFCWRWTHSNDTYDPCHDVAPILEQPHAWALRSGDDVAPSSAIGKALTYLLEHWPELIRYLVSAEHPRQVALGCLQYPSAAWRMQARDHRIGRHEARGSAAKAAVNTLNRSVRALSMYRKDRGSIN